MKCKKSASMSRKPGDAARPFKTVAWTWVRMYAFPFAFFDGFCVVKITSSMCVDCVFGDPPFRCDPNMTVRRPSSGTADAVGGLSLSESNAGLCGAGGGWPVDGMKFESGAISMPWSASAVGARARAMTGGSVGRQGRQAVLPLAHDSAAAQDRGVRRGARVGAFARGAPHAGVLDEGGEGKAGFCGEEAVVGERGRELAPSQASGGRAENVRSPSLPAGSVAGARTKHHAQMSGESRRSAPNPIERQAVRVSFLDCAGNVLAQRGVTRNVTLNGRHTVTRTDSTLWAAESVRLTFFCLVVPLRESILSSYRWPWG